MANWACEPFLLLNFISLINNNIKEEFYASIGVFMGTAHLILEYVQALIWPCVALFLLLRYRGMIESLIPRSKLKFTIAGVTIETSLDTIERSVEESFRGRPLSPEQWTWLRRLRHEGRLPYESDYYKELRPMRNSGLIREHPEGWLSASEEIEITTLGRLLLESHEKGERIPKKYSGRLPASHSVWDNWCRF